VGTSIDHCVSFGDFVLKRSNWHSASTLGSTPESMAGNPDINVEARKRRLSKLLQERSASSDSDALYYDDLCM